jgi:hypothetical protein
LTPAASDPTSGPVFGLPPSLKQVATDLGITSALGQQRLGKLALFLVLARIEHQGSRLSAAHWARDYAVAEVVGLTGFDDDNLCEALEDLLSTDQRALRTRQHHPDLE